MPCPRHLIHVGPSKAANRTTTRASISCNFVFCTPVSQPSKQFVRDRLCDSRTNRRCLTGVIFLLFVWSASDSGSWRVSCTPCERYRLPILFGSLVPSRTPADVCFVLHRRRASQPLGCKVASRVFNTRSRTTRQRPVNRRKLFSSTYTVSYTSARIAGASSSRLTQQREQPSVCTVEKWN